MKKKRSVRIDRAGAFSAPLLAVAAGLLLAAVLEAAKPEHAVIFTIDGLSYKAVEKLPLRNIEELIGKGVYYSKSYNVMPAHPKTGAWAQYHTCSIPNPVILAGTAMLRPGQKYVQHSFFPRRKTAHVVNATSYRTLNRGFHLSFMVPNRDGSATDARVIDWALKYLKGWRPAFMRIHLQQTGGAGSLSYNETDASKPWYRNIWAEKWPYGKTAVEADRQLGRFVAGLREMGLEDKTLLFVTSDHGQADTGWHPPEEESGWAMPLIVTGPGVQQGKRLEYAEQIDIVPTLAYLMGVKPPDNADGRVLSEALTEPPSDIAPRKHRIRDLNMVLSEGQRVFARLSKKAKSSPVLKSELSAAENEFLGIERILEWHKLGSMERVIEHNRRILERLSGVER